MRRVLLLLMQLLVFGGLYAAGQNAAPVLFYTDIDSGPATGGEGGTDGAFLCVYGENFGSSQGASTITIGGVQAAQYKVWSDPGQPYQAGTRIAKACVQISHSVPSGEQPVQLTTSGGASNTLSFTVRPGNIRWVAKSGSDSKGNGSQGKPWQTVSKCKSQMAAGDICILGDGLTIKGALEGTAGIWLNSDGAPGLPNALVVYPGKTVSVAIPTGKFQAINNQSPSTTPCAAAGCSYWTIAGFSSISGGNGAIWLAGGSNIRLVDNDILCQGDSCEQAEGMSGGLATATPYLYIYGNRFHDIGCHEDVAYWDGSKSISLHPCASITPSAKPTITLKTIGTAFKFSGNASGVVEGDVIKASGQFVRVISCNSPCSEGTLDSAFSSDLTKATGFQYRDFEPGRHWQNVYFGDNRNSDFSVTSSNHVWFAWNNVDGSTGRACAGVQLQATIGSPLSDIHLHDNFIHGTACDGIRFDTVDPAQNGGVEAYNNVIYSAGVGNGTGFNGGDPLGGPAHYSCIYSPGNASQGASGSGSVLLFNNTLYDCGGRVAFGNADGKGSAVDVGSGTDPNLFMVASNNIVYAASPVETYVQNPSIPSGICTGNSLPGQCPESSANNVFYGSSSAAPGNLTNSIVENPQLENPPGDFHLYVFNPAAGGSSATLASALDFDGLARSPINPTPGAYEYLSSPPANPRQPAASSTNLGADYNPQDYGLPVTFTVSVTPAEGSTSPMPSGQVMVYDGAAEAIELTLDGAGNAAYIARSLASGPHSLTANYLGDSNFAGSQGSLDQTINGPVAVLSATALNFSSPLNAPATQSLTLTNPGSMPLTIKSVTLSGSKTFSISNNGCIPASPPATLRPNASCTIAVTFTPSNISAQQGSIAVTVDAPAISQKVTLSGVGSGPEAALSATALSFTSSLNSPTAQSISLSNPGASPLTIDSITISGSKTFSITKDGCLLTSSSATLLPNVSCMIEVTFNPANTDTQQGSLKVSVAAPAVSQQATLTGVGSDFSFPATPPSMTIVSGQSALAMFSLTSVNGFSGPVALSCTVPGDMKYASCTLTNSVTVPRNSTSDYASLTVTTTAAQSATLLRHGPIGGALAMVLVGGVLLAVPRRRAKPGTAKQLLLLLAIAGAVSYCAGCGTGSSSKSNSTSQNTPPGTYSLVVSATSGAITHTMKVSVVVKT
jgi:hypothetical protein